MPAKTKEPTIFVARSSGAIKIDGEVYRYTKGQTRIRAGHPLLQALPDRFIPMSLDYDVEQSTAAPGEKRAV